MGDIRSLFKIYSDAEAMKYYGKEPLTNISESIAQIERLSKGFKNRDVIKWGITRAENNEVIGSCGYHTWVKEFGRAEIGFVLSKEYWSKGIMQEALNAILPFGFRKMNLNRIEALVEPKT